MLTSKAGTPTNRVMIRETLLGAAYGNQRGLMLRVKASNAKSVAAGDLWSFDRLWMAVALKGLFVARQEIGQFCCKSGVYQQFGSEVFDVQ